MIHHSTGDVDADTADLVVSHLDLAGVNAYSDLETEPIELLLQAKRAAHRPGGAVERRHNPVAGRLAELAAELLEMLTSHTIVDGEVIEPLFTGASA